MKALSTVILLVFIIICDSFALSYKKKKGSTFIDLNKNGVIDPYENPDLDIDIRLNNLLEMMSLEEKVGQLGCTLGWYYYQKDSKGNVILTDMFRRDVLDNHIGCFWATLRADPWTEKTLTTGLNPELAANMTNMMQQFVRDSTRLGIPLFLSEECPHGHMAIGATTFPTSIGMASTWNAELMENVGKTIAREARMQGAHIGYGPVLDVARELRWSRVEETFGEDPVLNGIMGSSMVKGFQGKDLSSGENVISTLKHFTAYGVPEGGHNAGMAHAGMRELLSELCLPFEMAVRNGALSIMTAYNEVDGIPCTANSFLINDILRGQWGFKGFVVSDLYSVDGLISQRVASNSKEAGALALESGVDSDLGANCFRFLLEACKDGLISEKHIDEAVSRILRLKFEMGLFDNPFVEPARTKVVGNAQAKELAKDAARQSIVLLKNEGGVLPLSKDIKSIAVIGPNADNVYNQLGDYTAPQHAGKVVTVLQGIKAKLPDVKVNYLKGCAVRDTSNVKVHEACELARESDVVVVVLGGSSARDFETEFIETGAAIANLEKVSDMESGEGFDRISLSLLGKQLELLKALNETGKPIVLVMIQGRPLEINWANENIPAILNAWYPGEQGGVAIADVLFGDYNPAGRLPVSYPREVGQLPVYYNHKSFSRHNYMDGSSQPLFPFGYGLSYSTFQYDNLEVKVVDDKIYMSVDVMNNGDYAGDEVVQLYVHQHKSSVVVPAIQLKNFKRINLEKGQTRRVEFVLNKEDFRILNREYKWEVETGKYNVMIGASCVDIRQTATFEIN